MASKQGTLTLPDTWFRPPFWDLLMLQLLRPNSSNLPCLYSTFHLEYPLVLSRFYLFITEKLEYRKPWRDLQFSCWPCFTRISVIPVVRQLHHMKRSTLWGKSWRGTLPAIFQMILKPGVHAVICEDDWSLDLSFSSSVYDIEDSDNGKKVLGIRPYMFEPYTIELSWVESIV